MTNNNFTDIQNKILQLLKNIDSLNIEYESLVNEIDKFSNSKKIDDIEAEIYNLENILLTDSTDSSYFLQVVDYKKWVIKNGNFVDNVDLLNKKMNLSNILNERVAILQMSDFNNKLAINNQQMQEYQQKQELEYKKQQELEYQRQMEEYQKEVEYQRQMEEYQKEVEYQRQMGEYKQELEYKRQMQEYQQQMQEYQQQQMQENIIIR